MVDEKKHPKAGTGDEFVRIDLGVLGVLVVKDDGHDDPDISSLVEHDGGSVSFHTRANIVRRNEGDAVLEAALKDAAEAHERRTSPPADYGVGIFVCDGCSRSWPRRQNQTPNQPDDTCPDCAGGDP